jgi:hypothetical protein
MVTTKDKIKIEDNGGIHSDIGYRCDLLPATALNKIADNLVYINTDKVNSDLMLSCYVNKCLMNILNTRQSDDPWQCLLKAAGYALFAVDANNNKTTFAIAIITKKEVAQYLNVNTGVMITDLPALAILECAKVMYEGAKNHGPEENWRLLSANIHLNHAEAHIWQFLAGDKAENHLPHAAARLLMALETRLEPMGEKKVGLNGKV